MTLIIILIIAYGIGRLCRTAAENPTKTLDAVNSVRKFLSK